MIEYIQNNYNYLIAFFLMLSGLYVIISSNNLVKKIIGLSIFQVSVLLLYISASFIHGGAAPIFDPAHELYVNPLPHVLMLTAIVVGVSIMAVGLAIIIRIKEEYKTIEEDEILIEDHNSNIKEHKNDIK